jgi:hypothetical protein
MGKDWELDDILERALQEEDLDRADAVIARLVSEERMSRSGMLKRSAAAAVGLTILGSPATAYGRSAATPRPPLRGGSVKFATIVRNAKAEGRINTIALPPTGRTTARSCRPSGAATG